MSRPSFLSLPTAHRASSTARTSPSQLRRRPPGRAAIWRRLVLRRTLAGICLSVACWIALGPLTTDPSSSGTRVVVAGADLPLGHVLTEQDLTMRMLPAGAAPSRAVRDLRAAVGQSLTAAVSQSEVLTEPRITAGAALTGMTPSTRVVHLPLLDTASLHRLGAGHHVDVIAVATGTVVASDVVVVDVDRPSSTSLVAESGTTRGLSVAVPADRVGPLTSAALSAGNASRGGVHIVSRHP
ncbi:hypothetical protein KEM60_01783 [Austwickia sp. TVS 96-490-7B]|uniref:SAF domain-containing protein n=1 Tax=Austwickia sp. TVS 96-490-7B TaxID=2830843 RepID=UPI001C57D501|nr:SAF domain-containing protein [Austwickia sp. TVS 96-490-7B]MBW3085582.1 hypothetical protein [Austwickia sp. TVS 96-490-7B]